MNDMEGTKAGIGETPLCSAKTDTVALRPLRGLGLRYGGRPGFVPRAACPATIAVAALLLGCEPEVRAPAFTLTQAEWGYHGAKGTHLVTDHFDIRTTLEDKMLVEVLPGFLEACYRRYEGIIPARSDAEDRLTTYIFNTRWEWGQFTDEFVPERAHLYRNIQNGGYTDQPTCTAVLYWIDRGRTLAVAAHEGWHQYVARHLPLQIPAWLNEGLATQMEAFELRGTVPTFESRKNYFRRNYLKTALIVKEKGLFDLSELLRMNAGDLFASPGKSSDTYYAQVWSLVLFLSEGPNKTYRDGFRRLLADAGSESMRVAVNAYRVATPSAANLSFGELVFRAYITDNLDAFCEDYIAFGKELVRGTPRAGTIPW
jgi:hypothetical protein